MSWLNPADVAAQLDRGGVDEAVADATDAAACQVERWRDDLFTVDPPPSTRTDLPADVYRGAVMYAAFLHDRKHSPQSFGGFDGEAIIDPSTQVTREIWTLIGRGRPRVG